MRSSAAIVLMGLGLGASACGSGGTGLGVPVSSSTTTSGIVAVARPKLPTCDAPDLKSRVALPLLKQGLDHVLARRRTAADAVFDQILRLTPGDLSAYALKEAAQATTGRLTNKRNDERGRAHPVALTVDSGHAPLKIGGGGAKPALVVADTAIDLDDEWRGARAFHFPTTFDDLGNGASSFGQLSLTHECSFQTHVAEVYGDSTIFVSPLAGSPMRAFDLHDTIAQGSTVQFARAVGNALIVAYQQATNSEMLIAAFDMTSKKLAWRTEPGDIASASFAVTGGFLIASTASLGPEDSDREWSLVTIDIDSGRVVDKTKLSQSAEWVFDSDGEIYVSDGSRAHQVTRKDGAKLAPAPDPELGASPAPDSNDAPDVIALEACQYMRAIDALEARDVDRAIAETRTFFDPDAEVARALSGAADFLRRVKLDPERTTDLGAAPIVVLRRPDPVALVGKKKIDLGPTPTLRPIDAQAKKKPSRGPQRPQLDTPIDDVETPPDPNSAPPLEPPPSPDFRLPEEFGGVAMHDQRAFSRGAGPNGKTLPARNLATYGTRYLAVLSGARAERVFDLAALPMGSSPTIEYTVIGDTLVLGVFDVAAGDPNQSSYVAGYDIGSGELLWRSASGVFSRAMFAIDNFIVAASAHDDLQADPTKKPAPKAAVASLFILRSDTGETTSNLTIDCLPTVGRNGKNVVTVCPNKFQVYEVDGKNDGKK